MADDAQKPEMDGVKLETLTINAATPDLVGQIFKKITDEVMNKIPPEVIEKIAQDVIATHGMLSTREWDGYARQYKEREIFNAKNYIAAEMRDRLKKSVDETVELLWRRPETAEAVRDIAIEAFTSSLHNIPQMLATNFYARVSGMMFGNSADVVQYASSVAEYAAARADSLRTQLEQNTNMKFHDNGYVYPAFTAPDASSLAGVNDFTPQENQSE